MMKPRPKPKLKKRLLAVPKENRLGGPKTAKLPYAEFKQMVLDPDVPDSEIAQYLTANPERGSAFDPAIVPDPSKVEVTAETELDVESAIRWGNAICRFRRQTRFERRLLLGENKPVLVSEGDSWFQFPFLIDDVIDQLAPDFLVWSLDAAGDTSDNMVNRHPEFMKGLELQKANGVAGFLFSGAGNDVIGEDLLGKPVLGSLLKQHQPGKDAVSHIDQAKYASILATLRNDYEKLVATVRTKFLRLPVFFHGYDYAIPGGFRGDNRRPVYAKQDEWLGVNRHRNGTPYRLPKGTPASGCIGVSARRPGALHLAQGPAGAGCLSFRL